MVTVNKGKWDVSDSLKYKHKFNKKWIKECDRILKDNDYNVNNEKYSEFKKCSCFSR